MINIRDALDFLERAKALCEDLKDGDDDYAEEREIIISLVREVEQLRSLNESLMENGNDLRTRCQKAEARIKKLEAEKERIESAFLKAESQRLWDLGKSTGETSYDCQEAHEALERIRSGKDVP